MPEVAEMERELRFAKSGVEVCASVIAVVASKKNI